MSDAWNTEYRSGYNLELECDCYHIMNPLHTGVNTDTNRIGGKQSSGLTLL